MLTHILADNPDCKWDNTQRNLVLLRMRNLDFRMQQARNTIATAQAELDKLHKIYQHEPVTQAARERHCRICQKKTRERFAGAPQCAKHVAGGDPLVTSILEELIHG